MTSARSAVGATRAPARIRPRLSRLCSPLALSPCASPKPPASASGRSLPSHTAVSVSALCPRRSCAV
jgi:hypothetical protein